LHDTKGNDGLDHIAPGDKSIDTDEKQDQADVFTIDPLHLEPSFMKNETQEDQGQASTDLESNQDVHDGHVQLVLPQ